jgi:hypothetical protein
VWARWPFRHGALPAKALSLYHQALLRGNVIAIGSAPLWPIRCPEQGGGKTKKKHGYQKVFRLHGNRNDEQPLIQRAGG